MTEAEWIVIGQMLQAVTFGPFLKDGQKQHGTYTLAHTLIGISHQQLKAVAAAWPDVDWEDDITYSATNGIGHIFFSPHQRWKHRRRFVAVSPQRGERILEKRMRLYASGWSEED